MKEIAKEKIDNIKNLLQQGKSTRDVAKLAGCGRTTVQKYRKELEMPPLTPRAGAPSKLSPRDMRDLARQITASRAKTAVELTREINATREKKVSTETVRRALRKCGLTAVKKIKKPLISAQARRARLKWAIEHRYWTLEDWKRVVWSDETKINFINSDGIAYAWVHNPKKICPEIIKEMVKYGGGSIMIWGCISWYGPGGMSKVEGRMDSSQYTQILEHALLPTLNHLSELPGAPPREKLIFQQDNDSKHTSAHTRNWMRENNIKPMIWPAHSPDLNPIEHIWAQLKRRLGQYPEMPRGVHQLWSRVQAEWSEALKGTCRGVVESMPERIEAVICARGGHTRY